MSRKLRHTSNDGISFKALEELKDNDRIISEVLSDTHHYILSTIKEA